VAIENDGIPTAANMCCDIAVIEDHELKNFVTDQSIPNEWLLTFAEVKHMSAYPELIASFLGLVHELLPKRLKELRTVPTTLGSHPSPFLYVSGILWAGALTMEETLVNRAYDLDIYHHDRAIGTPRVREEFDENALLTELTDDIPF
jgi:hypothetical protein